jgi:transketolase
MRRAFAESIVEIAQHDERFIFVTGDLGFGVFGEYESKFPDRYINAGVAEAQMVCFAAGLALAGFRPLVYSIASFATGRAFEQIRISVGYQQLPVVIVGAGGGLIYSSSGVTHHALEDFALMTSIPGMEVYSPGDPVELKKLLPKILSSSSPAYLRIGKFGEPNLPEINEIIPGKARVFQGSSDTVIFSCGDCSYTALEAISKLNPDFPQPTLLHFHTISPFDIDTASFYLANCKNVIVIEEHYPIGGIYSKVLELVANLNLRIKIQRLGPELSLMLGNRKREEVAAIYGYDKNGIMNALIKNQS